MISHILGMGCPPALIFIIGALFVPLFRGRLKSAWMLMVPVLSFLVLVTTSEGTHWTFTLLDHELILGRVDRLSQVFGHIFTLISFIAVIFALKVGDDVQHVAGLTYAGSALGITYAGDFLTLYIFWEIMAVSSAFLILARKTKASQSAAFRYMLVHVFGGLCLLAGIVMYVQETGSIWFGHIGLEGVSSWLIFSGIAVNAAIPPLHPWLKDAYPEATVTGAVFLSAFTTKSAVYVMARTFPGTELLIWLGALMAILPIFYAEIENDIRRILGYSLINQVGFMMCGIGIGSPLAINGTVSHAFCHILYKALLFMSAGSVLYETGKIRCTDIGGLYKTMPLTCAFCVIGAASISAFPLFSGFVSKSMIIGAAAQNHLAAIWFMLKFASAGVIVYAGIRIPYFTFFGHDSGIRAKEPPLNMLIAMAMAAFLCVFIGVFPQPLYDILPYPVDYVPYTAAHVVDQLQLLMFGILAFYLLFQSGYCSEEIRAINLDADWFYRKGGKWLFDLADNGLNRINAFCDRVFAQNMTACLGAFSRHAPARLALVLIIPIGFLMGKKKDEAACLRKKVWVAFETASAPIGISVAAAALFIVVLVFMSSWGLEI